MARMQVSMITALVLFQLQAAGANTNGSGPSLRGSQPRVLGAFNPDMTKTASAVWHAIKAKSETNQQQVKSRITQNWAVIADASQKAGIADVKELAMFIANAMHESADLSTKVEYASNFNDEDYNWGVCENVGTTKDATSCNGSDGTKCCKGKGCKDICKVHYFGRGYLQTSYYNNYKEAKESGCTVDSNGKQVDIVANPGLVGEDETLAWCTAAYYWKANVHDDRCTNGCEMGNTIHAINGDLECGVAAGKQKAQRRFCNFRYFYEGYMQQKLTKTWWADETCIKDLDGMCPL